MDLLFNVKNVELFTVIIVVITTDIVCTHYAQDVKEGHN